VESDSGRDARVWGKPSCSRPSSTSTDSIEWTSQRFLVFCAGTDGLLVFSGVSAASKAASPLRSALHSTGRRVWGSEGFDGCRWDEFQGVESEERRCFGVRAAERSVDAALVVCGDATLSGTPGGNPIPSQSAPLEAARNPQRGHLRTLRNPRQWHRDFRNSTSKVELNPLGSEMEGAYPLDSQRSV
jgi:hypothetical protein